MSQLALQRAVYERLRTVLVDYQGEVIEDSAGDDVTPVIALEDDAVAQVAETTDGSQGYPYVTVGVPSHLPFDTKTSLGFRAIVRISAYSREGGPDQVHEMQGKIYRLMHRQPLAIARRDAVSVTFNTGFVMDDPDGITKHGVQEFVVIYEWAPQLQGV